MKKKIYITPQLEEIHLKSDFHLLAGSDDGHGGGDPTDIPGKKDPNENDAKLNRVGYSIDLWSDDEDVVHGNSGLWK